MVSWPTVLWRSSSYKDKMVSWLSYDSVSWSSTNEAILSKNNVGISEINDLVQDCSISSALAMDKW